MNRCFVAAIAAVAAIGMTWSTTFAQDGATRPKRERPRLERPERPDRPDKGERATRPGRDMGKNLLDTLIKELKLTADQAKQLAQAVEAQKQAVQNWDKEHGAEAAKLRQQIDDARKAGEREKVRDLMEQARKLAESRKALHENFMKQLEDVLTKEQMEKARGFFAQNRPLTPATGAIGFERIKAAIAQIDLGDDQKAKIEEILKAARTEAEKTDGLEAKAKIWRDAFDKIRTDVLTEEQRKTLAEVKPPGMPELEKLLEKLNLTQDQKGKIQDIVQDARKKAAQAKGDELKAIWQAAHKKILDDVLTPEQRKQLQDFRKEGPEKLKEGVREKVRERREKRGPRDATPAKPGEVTADV